MAAYYNEIDAYAAQWLRNLIAAGHIAPGDWVHEHNVGLHDFSRDYRFAQDARPDDLLSEAERRELLVAANDTAAEIPGLGMHELFEATAARRPGAVAVSFEGQSLTYGDLNTRANRLAHALRRLGVGPDVLVGLCVERSPDLLVGLLGVLKAGGAYVPLDPAYPSDRIAWVLEDAKAPVTHLTLEAHLRRFGAFVAAAPWDLVDSDERGRWRRDAPLLRLGDMARQARTVAAWRVLEGA